jgi:hypothetical protein
MGDSQSGAGLEAFPAPVALGFEHLRPDTDCGDIFKDYVAPFTCRGAGATANAEAPTDNIDCFVQFRVHYAGMSFET